MGECETLTRELPKLLESLDPREKVLRNSEFSRDWLSCTSLLHSALFVIQTRSQNHQTHKVLSTLQSIGLGRIGDFRLLADIGRERGKLRIVAHRIEVVSPTSIVALKVLNSKKGNKLKVIDRADKEGARRLIKFKTSEYVSREKYDDDVAIAWTTVITFLDALELAVQSLKNDGEFRVYISSPEVNPARQLKAEEARVILSGKQGANFLRVDSRFESFTFGPSTEEVSFAMHEAALIMEAFDGRRISEAMRKSGSPMVRANIDRVLHEMGIGSIL